MPTIQTRSITRSRLWRYVTVNSEVKGLLKIPHRPDEPYYLQLTEGDRVGSYTYDSLVDLAEALRDKFGEPQ